MAKVTKRIHNSTKTFLGGGMGALIPIRDSQMKPSIKQSEADLPNSQQLKEIWHNEISQEVREQMGYQPETEESDSPTGQDKKD